MTDSTVINEQAFAIFTLMEVAEDLTKKAKKLPIADVGLFEYGLQELSWLTCKQQEIFTQIQCFTGQYQGRSLCNFIESSIEQDGERIRSAFDTLCDVSMEALTNPQSTNKGQRLFVRSLESLSLSLKQTYNLLNSLRDGLPAQ